MLSKMLSKIALIRVTAASILAPKLQSSDKPV